jgi:hypothetical protein
MTRTISIHIIAFFLWLKVSAKNFPEIITLPLCILALCLTPLMLELTGINALFNYFHNDPSQPNRSLQAFEIMLIAMIYVFLANAAAYAAIKYNRRDIWEQYTDREETTRFGCKELRFYWACYFFGILAAIFLAHSLIVH